MRWGRPLRPTRPGQPSWHASRAHFARSARPGGVYSGAPRSCCKCLILPGVYLGLAVRAGVAGRGPSKGRAGRQALMQRPGARRMVPRAEARGGFAGPGGRDSTEENRSAEGGAPTKDSRAQQPGRIRPAAVPRCKGFGPLPPCSPSSTHPAPRDRPANSRPGWRGGQPVRRPAPQGRVQACGGWVTGPARTRQRRSAESPADGADCSAPTPRSRMRSRAIRFIGSPRASRASGLRCLPVAGRQRVDARAQAPHGGRRARAHEECTT
jgi:hypothetical protein